MVPPGFLALFLLLISSLSLPTNALEEPGGISITKSNLKRNHTPGELIFADEFDTFELETWRHESTLGGLNPDFQMYTNNRTISYAKDGILFIKPILTSDVFGEEYLTTGKWDLRGSYPIDMCTDPRNYGCFKEGQFTFLNPVMSAKLKTVNSFYFKYGRLVVRAKLPAGDWMWPFIGLLPRFNAYGPLWPMSGDIRVMESRGNQELYDGQNNVGSEIFGYKLHYGTFWDNDGYWATQGEKRSDKGKGFDTDFHEYGLTWTDEYIELTLDGTVSRKIVPPTGGFWELGRFDNRAPCPWRHSTNKMAPFDQKFYLVISVGVGSEWYWPDPWVNKKGNKPWSNWSGTSSRGFWQGRKDWYPTWDGENGALQIDYVRVYAI